MSQNSLSVNMQIVLAVALSVVSFVLVFACIFCCRRRKSVLLEDEETAATAALSSVGQARLLNLASTPSPCLQLVRQQCDELNPPPSPFFEKFPSLRCPPAPDVVQSSKTFASTRRFSSPAAPSPPRSVPSHSRSSLPSLTKVNALPKSSGGTEERRILNLEKFPQFEKSPIAESSARMLPLQKQPRATKYGSASLTTCDPAPLLHFSLLLSSTHGTLMLNVLGISLDSRRRSTVTVRASLPPLHPAPQQVALRRHSLSADLHSQSFVVRVGSLEALGTCTLRLAVHSRDFSGLREAPLGFLELPCEQMKLELDVTTIHTKQLNSIKGGPKKSLSSQHLFGRRKSSVCAPAALGKLLVLLQYQAQGQRIKVMVRKAENLPKVTKIPGAADHYVVINLRQDGKVIGTKETKGVSGSDPVWNAPFLFDLPPGDIARLPLALEFIILQCRLYTKSTVLGCVVIGSIGPEAGQEHWREMWSLQHTETTRWHTVLQGGE